jgi:hypothetical protein
MSLTKKILEFIFPRHDLDNPDAIDTSSVPVVANKIDINTEYPFSVSVHNHETFKSSLEIIKCHMLINDVDYVYYNIFTGDKIPIGNILPNGSQVRFKYQTDMDAVSMLYQKIVYEDNILHTYEKEINKYYIEERFKIKNNLTKSIEFLPKTYKFIDCLKIIMKFYEKNNYDLPENPELFKSNLLVADKNNRKFIVYVRDENEAAQLILELSEFVNIK